MWQECKCTIRFSQDLVDISDMYDIMVIKSNIGKGSFQTCKSYEKQIKHQTRVYNKFSTKSYFWDFIYSTNRIASSQQHREIEEFIRNGIPPRARANVWKQLARIDLSSKGVNYKDLLQMTINKEDAEQIALDVARTFTNEIKDREYKLKTSRLLTAYANRNPELGYCQSMSYLAATVLLFMPEELAFWMLVYLVEDFLPNYHSKSMNGVLADVQVFKWLVAEDLPELHKHLQRSNCNITSVVSSWFVLLFVTEVPHVTAFLIWDNVLLKGSTALFEVGLALLHLLQDELMMYHDDGDLLDHIQQRTKEIYDPKQLFAHWKKLDANKIKTLRGMMHQREEETTHINAPLNVAEFNTHFDTEELQDLWSQFTTILPLDFSTGMNFEQFSQFVGGTFNEWWVDEELVQRLFYITVLRKENAKNFKELMEINSSVAYLRNIEFRELVTMLSVVCRGTLNELGQLLFDIFDVKGRGWLDKSDLARMFQSLFGMFRHNKKFSEMVSKTVNDVFSSTYISFRGAIDLQTFQEYVVLRLPQILDSFSAQSPHRKYNLQNTFFYFWMNTVREGKRKEEEEEKEGEDKKGKRGVKEKGKKRQELIAIALDKHASFKQKFIWPILIVK